MLFVLYFEAGFLGVTLAVLELLSVDWAALNLAEIHLPLPWLGLKACAAAATTTQLFVFLYARETRALWYDLLETGSCCVKKAGLELRLLQSVRIRDALLQILLSN